jgi:hypothetical protein
MFVKTIATQHEDVEFGHGCQQIDSLLSKMTAVHGRLLPSSPTTAFVFGTQSAGGTPASRIARPKRHNPHPDYFTPRQLAKRWNVHVDKILAFIKSGTLAAFNAASLQSTRPRYRISMEAVAAFEHNRSIAGHPAVNKIQSSRVRRQRDRPAARTYF